MTIDYYSTRTRFEEMAAYSRAVADDHAIHVSGTVGSDPATGAIPDAVEDQLANIFATLEMALAWFGAGFGDVLRTRVFITSADILPVVAAALRIRFAAHPPANTTLICGIPAPGAKVEIELTARRPA